MPTKKKKMESGREDGRFAYASKDHGRLEPWPIRPVRAIVREEAGSALPAVLVLIVVVTTLAGAVMAVHLAQHRFIRRDVHRLQAYYAAEAGLYEALVRLEQEPRWRAQGADVSCAGASSCRIWAEAYGGFVHLIAEGRVKGQTGRSQAFAAQGPVPLFESAVALEDERADLTLAGTTQVIGPVTLDQGQVTEGALQGQPFAGRFEGEVRPAPPWSTYEARLPRETMQRRREALQHPPEDARSIEAVREGGWADESQDRQADQQRRRLRPVYAASDLVLTAADHILGEKPVQLLTAGNLRVRGALHFQPGTQLIARDTLWITGEVVAPRSLLVAGRTVIIEEWGRGSTQVLAGRGITVRGAAPLAYPSLLYVDGWMDASDEVQGRYGGPVRTGRIDVLDGARVDGTVLYPPAPESGAKPETDLGRIHLAEGAEVRGALYSSARTELAGTVHGSVLTRTFHFYRSPTNYVNWIDGGVADVTRRPSGFLTPIGFDGYGEAKLDLIRLKDDTPRGMP